MFINLPIKYVKYANDSDELTTKVLADIGKSMDDEIESELILNTSFNVFDLIKNIEIRPLIDEEYNVILKNRSHVSCNFGELEVYFSPEDVIKKILFALDTYERISLEQKFQRNETEG